MDALQDLKKDLNKNVKELERENTVKKEILENNESNTEDLFTLKKKKKNITDGCKAATFYLTRENINFINTMCKNTGMNKSEFVQHVINLAQQTLKIE